MEERPSVTDNVAQQNKMTSDQSVVPDVSLNLMQEIGHNIQNILVEMTNVRRDFETKVMYDESKERVIETLHRELQDYREGLHFRILKPLFIDLIVMYDDLGKQIERMDQNANPLAKEVKQDLELFQESIEETLHRNDVDTFSVEDDVFLPSKQKILRIIPTENLALDRHIARRVRKGFHCAGKILRPEIVETYKYTPLTSR